jgi:predicted ArsR family transcriptional regulator
VLTEPDETTGDRSLDADAFHGLVTAMTSAFGDPTRREIYVFAREGNEVTAAAVAQRFDLHPNVARHHLEKLASGGYLVVETPKSDGSAGRPAKHYRAAADDAFPVPLRRDDILASLLARALDLLGPEHATAMADEVGYEYGRDLASRIDPTEGSRSVRAALSSVADALTAHGFAAHAESDGDAFTIVSECCPFGEAATNYPHVVCAVDRGMIRGLLAGLYGETDPRFEETRPDGDDHCVARVPAG